MITLSIGFIVLCLAVFAQWLLAIPAFIAAYMETAIVPTGLLAIAVIAVALGSRGVDKIRGV